ncbi:MAG: Phosphopantetheine adenylyltransferase, partial [uncultured Ramlibacter sp.]
GHHPSPHRRLPRHLRPHDPGARGRDPAGDPAVRSGHRGSGCGPPQEGDVHADRAHRHGPRCGEELPAGRGGKLLGAAARLRRGAGRQGHGARAARRDRLRLRVPAGGHEPQPDARRGDGLPHPQRQVPVHQQHLRARDRGAGRRDRQVRLALGAAAADGEGPQHRRAV